jgi:hypothetical protein
VRGLREYLEGGGFSLSDGDENVPLLREALANGHDYHDDDGAIYGGLYWDIWIKSALREGGRSWIAGAHERGEQGRTIGVFTLWTQGATYHRT